MKKISAETARGFLKEETGGEIVRTYKVGDGEFEARFSPELTVSERAAFVRRVSDGVFDADGEYRPEYFEPVFRATVMQMMTNFPALTLRGVNAPSGGAALDVDGMARLYAHVMPDFMGQSEDAERAVDEMRGVCADAVRWRRGETRRRTDAALREAAEAAKALADGINEKIDALDAGKLFDALAAALGSFEAAASKEGARDETEGDGQARQGIHREDD